MYMPAADAYIPMPIIAANPMTATRDTDEVRVPRDESDADRHDQDRRDGQARRRWRRSAARSVSPCRSGTSRIDEERLTASIGPHVLEGQHRDHQVGGDDPRQAAGEAEDPPQDPEPVLEAPGSRCPRLRPAGPTRRSRRGDPRPVSSELPIVGVRPSMRSLAAKTSATLKITVAAEATTDPQAKANNRAKPVWPRSQHQRQRDGAERDQGGHGGHDREPDHLAVLAEQLQRGTQNRLARRVRRRHWPPPLVRRRYLCPTGLAPDRTETPSTTVGVDLRA